MSTIRALRGSAHQKINGLPPSLQSPQGLPGRSGAAPGELTYVCHSSKLLPLVELPDSDHVAGFAETVSYRIPQLSDSHEENVDSSLVTRPEIAHRERLD